MCSHFSICKWDFYADPLELLGWSVLVFRGFFCSFFDSIGKNRRLKQAKEEAQAEIEQYRLQREKEFKTKEAAVGAEVLCNERLKDLE